MVWKESKELGVGKARSKSGKIMVVANYGNYQFYASKYEAASFLLKKEHDLRDHGYVPEGT